MSVASLVMSVAVLLTSVTFARGERAEAFAMVSLGPTTGPAPFVGVVEPSIAAAEEALGVHIPRPASWAANDSRVRSVVVDLRNRWVALTYAPLSTVGLRPYGRVQVIVEFRGRLFETQDDYRRWALGKVRGGGSVASLAEVAGRWAIVMRGNFEGDCGHPSPGEDGCAPAQHNPSALLMQFGRSNMTIYGPPSWDPRIMEAVAASVR
jgi:hypothetical protein